MKTILLAAILSGTVFSVTAPGSPAVTFQADFDSDFAAKAGNTKIQGVHSAGAEAMKTGLKDGKKGKAALIGTGADKKADFHITFQNKTYLPTEKGSISFWVKSEDWTGNDKNFHIFFRANGKNSDLLIYKVAWAPQLGFLIGSTQKINGKNVWSSVMVSVKDWKPGQWHFVAAVWGDGKVQLYVDGQLKGSNPMQGSAWDPFLRFGIGGLRPAAWNTPTNYSLLDDFKIYDSMLSAGDVAAAFRQ